MFTSVPSNENVASFLFEKQYALIYQVVVSRSFFELETIRNTVRSTVTLIMHQLCYFRPVLPLHSTYPIDLQSKSVTCFLCNENTTNPRHDIFHILFSTLLKTFFTPFPKFTTQSDFTKTTETLSNNRHKQFYDIQNTHQIKLYTFPNLLKNNNFNLKGYNRSRYCLSRINSPLFS